MCVGCRYKMCFLNSVSPQFLHTPALTKEVCLCVLSPLSQRWIGRRQDGKHQKGHPIPGTRRFLPQRKERPQHSSESSVFIILTLPYLCRRLANPVLSLPQTSPFTSVLPPWFKYSCSQWICLMGHDLLKMNGYHSSFSCVNTPTPENSPNPVVFTVYRINSNIATSDGHCNWSNDY